jgi:respiratory burst oxidase
MLPIFLNDLTSHGNHHSQDLVEVTLELDDDDDDIVVYSVAPVPNDLSEEAGTGILGRSLSATSRSIRRTLGRLIRSSSSRTVASSDSVDLALPAREARKLKAKLQRTRSSAQRALNGLRFISKTTGASDAEELWKQVEARFESLAVDGLLARADFGQCIGKDLKLRSSLIGFF